MPYSDNIIVIIATSHHRTRLLMERSLKSVYGQVQVNPHQVYIVDDNPVEPGKSYSDEYQAIKKVIKKLRNAILKPKFEELKRTHGYEGLKFDNYFHTTLLRNTRTQGHSGTGAWNTAAFKSMQYSACRNLFLAFLDDDDAWEPIYLTTLYHRAAAAHKEQVNGKWRNIQTVAAVAGILRIEHDKTVAMAVSPETFAKEDFFVGNPGLQGSNLFIDLKTFWAIGGFDESLQSATDRDIGIRLAEYVRSRPSKAVAFIGETLVRHYADSNERVTANREKKKEGLDLFYRKYYHLFPEELQKKSTERAGKLFGYTKSDSSMPVLQTKSRAADRREADISPFNLIVGVTSASATNLTEFLKSFLELYGKYGFRLSDYLIVVLDNSGSEYEIRPAVGYFVTCKRLNIELIAGEPAGRPISQTRTRLQQKIYQTGKKRYGGRYVAWIIDDDLQFRMDTDDGILVPDYFYQIAKWRGHDDIDALFGLNSDAPPLPFLSTLRTQLVDFYYHLGYFANCRPEAACDLNRLQSSNMPLTEFYYDLSSRNCRQLEYPYYAGGPQPTNADAFLNFLKATSLLANGCNVFRKITFAEEQFGDFSYKRSIYRGGNTIIYNPDLLLTPNYVPEDSLIRRSDFNWAIINTYIHKYNLYEIVLPLKHDRMLQKTGLLTNKEKLSADINAMVFYRLLRHLLARRDWGEMTGYAGEVKYYNRIKCLTLRKIKINNYRIEHLLHLILEIIGNKKLWWYKNEYRARFNYLVRQNIFTAEVLRIDLGKRNFQQLIAAIESTMTMDSDFVAGIVDDMREIAGARPEHFNNRYNDGEARM